MEWERQSRWSCCFCLRPNRRTKKEMEIADADRENVAQLTKKTMNYPKYPIRGVPCTRVLHVHQVFWHMVRWNLCVFIFGGAVLLLGLTVFMFLVMLFELDCRGPLSQWGVANPFNYTGLYASCEEAPDSRLEFMLDQLWFALQTVTTVGYGVLAPYNWFNSILSGMMGCAGVVLSAIYCGVAFARYSLVWETALVAHSCRAVITTYKGIPT